MQFTYMKKVIARRKMVLQQVVIGIQQHNRMVLGETKLDIIKVILGTLQLTLMVLVLLLLLLMNGALDAEMTPKTLLVNR